MRDDEHPGQVGLSEKHLLSCDGSRRYSIPFSVRFVREIRKKRLEGMVRIVPAEVLMNMDQLHMIEVEPWIKGAIECDWKNEPYGIWAMSKLFALDGSRRRDIYRELRRT